MADEVIIYGKDSCPYTVAARDDYRDRGVAFRYVNVKKDPQGLEAMLRADQRPSSGAGDCRSRPDDRRVRRHLKRVAGVPVGTCCGAKPGRRIGYRQWPTCGLVKHFT